MEYKLVALLPMKANSERVRGKNFREMAGKPLYRWILDSLLKLPEVDLVVINTDAEHILCEQGLDKLDRVLIRQRKPEICGDFVSMNLVLADDIANIKSQAYIMTHTTNPLLKSETIKKCIDAYQAGVSNKTHDSLFTVTKRQTRFYDEKVQAINHDPKNLIRTQDLPPYFEENSNLYIFSEDSFKKADARIGLKPMMFETPKMESYDIDDPEDWTMTEAMALYLKQKGEV